MGHAEKGEYVPFHCFGAQTTPHTPRLRRAQRNALTKGLGIGKLLSLA
jgi:hypothetical protein